MSLNIPSLAELEFQYLDDPITFFGQPLTLGGQQDLTGAQWALLTQPLTFWNEKDSPKDPNLWVWAIESANVKLLHILEKIKQLHVPAHEEALIRLFLKAPTWDKTDSSVLMDIGNYVRQHPAAWTTSLFHSSAPEVLMGNRSTKLLPLLEGCDPVSWTKTSNGDSLIHIATRLEWAPGIKWCRSQGISDDQLNNEGISAQDIATTTQWKSWPSDTPTSSVPASSTPKARKPKTPAVDNQMDLF